MRNKNFKRTIFVGSLLVAFAVGVNAQFSSGSTGADGSLDLSTMSCPQDVCEVQLPESGTLNYTTVNVPLGKVLTFRRNARNSPVILLTQGNVTISGEVRLDATGRIPGPGGFYGGQPGLPGFGPGGGIPSVSFGSWVGPLSLVPIIGGSGGSGGSGGAGGNFGFSGGGGGGAIVIASSSLITLTGQLYARGSGPGNCGCNATVGSGGAIRLVANNLMVSGSLNACYFSSNAACGVVRLESTSLTFTGSSTPAATLAPINPDIISNSQPQLSIQSVGGYTVPSYAGSRFDTIDVLLPNQLTDPVAVAISAANIPTGTQVNVGFVSGSPGGTSAPCNLAGSLASSTCTATISNLNRTAVTYLLATASFTPPGSLAQFNPKGPNHVAKVRLEAALGAKLKYIFLNSNGKPINNNDISKQFLQFFGN